jgi:hypothetical protein
MSDALIAQNSPSARNQGGSMLEKITKVSVTIKQCVWAISILFLASAACAQNGLTITVNCDNGQSLNRTLSQLNKQMPVTVIVLGTCTEYVAIDGFEGLALRGQSGAAIQQPESAFEFLRAVHHWFTRSYRL